MDFFTSMSINASGLSAQRTRMNVISMNLSNMHTTSTKAGGPYRRKIPVFATSPLKGSFGNRLESSLARQLSGVRVTKIIEDGSDFRIIYDPAHPDADKFGYVRMPNVNLMREMVNMLTAKRSYEANITALNATKNMALKSLELLK